MPVGTKNITIISKDTMIRTFWIDYEEIEAPKQSIVPKNVCC